MALSIVLLLQHAVACYRFDLLVHQGKVFALGDVLLVAAASCGESSPMLPEYCGKMRIMSRQQLVVVEMMGG